MNYRKYQTPFQATSGKSLKPRQREAVLERMLADDKLSADITDTVAVELRRHQPRSSFRWGKPFRRSRSTSDELAATRQLKNNFDAKDWQW